MFQYSAKDAVSLIPVGDYQAEVKATSDKPSSAGNPMLTITFDVFYDGRRVPIREYIVKQSTWKLRHIAVALGEEKAFDGDVFDVAQHIGKLLTVSIGIEKSKDGKRDFNRIMAYNPGSFEPEALATVAVAQEKDGEIPW